MIEVPNRRTGCGFIGTLILCAVTLIVNVIGSYAEEVTGRPGFDAWTGDFDGMAKRRLIRILVPFSKTIYFIDGGQQLGTAVELGQALEKDLNAKTKKEVERIRIAFVPMSRERLLPALNEGLGDIVAANLTITPKRLEVVDFTTPFASNVSEILVTGPAAPPVSSFDDLGGQDIMVRRTSSYFEHIEQLNTERTSAGKKPIVVRDADENLEDEDLMEMVEAGLLPWCIVDGHKAAIWAKVFDHIVPHEEIAISQGGDIAWAVRKDSPRLLELLNGFAEKHRAGTTFGNILKKRYYQDDKVVRAANAKADLERLDALKGFFQRHGKTYAFDPLMLAAQGYQESRLDQTERSPRGAVGVMQLLPSTAADKAVAIAGIAESADHNIEAGAKYLRHLSEEYVDGEGLTPVNRMLLSLAAYNAGPGNLRKFRRATVQMGLDPKIWFGNVENGAAQVVGRETVQYVANIYKYYIAYGLYVEQQENRSDAKNTAAQ